MNTRLQVEHPGDRGHHRPRPRAGAAAHRLGRAAAVLSGGHHVERPCHRVPRLRRGLDAAAARSRAGCFAIASPASSAAGRPSGSIPASVRARPSPSTTIRCWRSSSRTRRRARPRSRPPRRRSAEFEILGVHHNIAFLRALLARPEVRAERDRHALHRAAPGGARRRPAGADQERGRGRGRAHERAIARRQPTSTADSAGRRDPWETLGPVTW